MEKQFEDVPNKRGAPMGRASFGKPPARDIDLFEVRMVDGDYDDGGAYWGGPPSDPLYCARAEDYLDFVRAKDRVDAAKRLGLHSDQLTTPLDEGQLEAVLYHYAVAALWSSHDERWPANSEAGEFLDDNFDVDDIAPETMTQMREDCADFLRANQGEVQLALALRADYTEASVGHDFWLTRNRHGAGFWDRGLGLVGERLTEAAHVYGSVDLYVGDDGLIHA